MGRPKLLLPWGGSTVLAHLIAQWRSAGAAQIAVVCAEENAALLAELERLGVRRERRIVNPDASRGMFSSIQCAAAWRDGSAKVQHIAMVLGDQPHLSMKTLRLIVEFAAKNPGKICQPARAGRRRHPVLIPFALLPTLAASKAGTLKDFLAAHGDGLALLEIDDPGLDFDIDTPRDYEEALQKFGCDDSRTDAGR